MDFPHTRLLCRQFYRKGADLFNSEIPHPIEPVNLSNLVPIGTMKPQLSATNDALPGHTIDSVSNYQTHRLTYLLTLDIKLTTG